MGNCITPCTFKLVSNEVRGNNRNGRDGQKCQDTTRSGSSESNEAEDFNFLKPAVPCKNTRGGIVKVKLVVRKQELVDLLSNGLAKGAAIEDLLVELQAKLGHQSSTAVYNPCKENCHSGWRPSLESIPEENISTNN